MIPAADQWGPFMEGIGPTEQRARLRTLRAPAKVYAGPRAFDLCRLLDKAETDAIALEPALQAVGRMAPLDRKHILTSFAAIHCPNRRCSHEEL